MLCFCVLPGCYVVLHVSSSRMQEHVLEQKRLIQFTFTSICLLPSYHSIRMYLTHALNAGACRVLVGKPEGRRPRGRSSRTWEDNIKVDLRDMDWIDLAQGRDRWLAVVNAVMKLSFSGRILLHVVIQLCCLMSS